MKTLIQSKLFFIALLFFAIPNLFAVSKKELEANLATCQEEKASVQAILDATVTKFNTAVGEKEKLTSKAFELNKKVADLQAKLEAAPIREYEDLKLEFSEMQTVKNRIISNLDERMTLKDQALAQLAVYKTDLEARIQMLEQELKRLEMENAALKSRLQKSGSDK
ncbi:MAG: hypothetical protein ABIA75_10695 [Candidatus Neomarinimicrobiota bacterium]